MASLPQSGVATLAGTYPRYLVAAHANVLLGATSVGSTDLEATGAGTYPYNVQLFMEQAIDENPYAIAEGIDPTPYIDDSLEAITEFKDLVDSYLTSIPDTDGEQQTFEDFITKAAALFATHGIDVDTDLNAEVNAFESASQPEYLFRKNQFESGMREINALDTSCYIFGISNIVNERQRQISAFRAGLWAQGRRDKNVFLIQAAELMQGMQGRNAGLKQAVAAMLAEFQRFAYATQTQKNAQDLEFDIGEVTWEEERAKSFLSAIGAMQGIPIVPTKPSNFATAVSTALSIGPQVGIAVGSATGNPALGLLAGGLGALFSYTANING